MYTDGRVSNPSRNIFANICVIKWEIKCQNKFGGQTSDQFYIVKLSVVVMVVQDRRNEV